MIEMASSSSFSGFLASLDLIFFPSRQGQEELVARFFYKYTDEDYKKLCRVFPYKYSIDVITLASQNLSANASEFVRLRLESRSLSVCNFLHHQLHERPDNFRTNVIGVLCGYHELDLSKVTAEYQRLYHTSLADSLKVGFCGDLLDVLRHIIQVISCVFQRTYKLDIRKRRGSTAPVIRTENYACVCPSLMRSKSHVSLRI